MDRLISIGELAELKAVSVDTIRPWEREGKIKSVRTDGGHRRYKLGDYVEQATGKTIAYASVNEDKHVWSFWSELNKKIKRSSQINRRHDYFTVSNSSFLDNLSNEEA